MKKKHAIRILAIIGALGIALTAVLPMLGSF